VPNSTVRLNHRRLAIVGYSVSAQMVSRCYNNFPSLRTPAGRPFPRIRAGILIGGGSMHCYEYLASPQEVQRIQRQGAAALPSDFRPCNPAVAKHPLRLGCCPHDRTEDVYDNRSIPWAAHPATLLLQSHDDDQATTGASQYYFNVMKARGATAAKIVAAGIVHGLVESQVGPAASFLREFV
jgi:hypothetical protein